MKRKKDISNVFVSVLISCTSFSKAQINETGCDYSMFMGNAKIVFFNIEVNNY